MNKKLNTSRATNFGFTIVELLIVIIVIAILATLVIVAYNSVQGNAAEAEHEADRSTVYKAILIARERTGDPLIEITDNGCTVCSCWTDPPTEPKDQPKSSDCWEDYYNTIDDISEASGINLDKLKKSDSRGNPAFYLDENEGEDSENICRHDVLGWWKDDDIDPDSWQDVPYYLEECR